MVKRCAWGTCNADERYPDRLDGGHFIGFPSPKRNLEACRRWIKACGRPHEQLNVERINRHKVVCSRHFVGGNGPTADYPDPVNADGTFRSPARRPPRKRKALESNSSEGGLKRKCDVFTENRTILNEIPSDKSDGSAQAFCQTEEAWVSPIDMLCLTAENESLKNQVKRQEVKISRLTKAVAEKEKEIKELRKDIEKPKVFGAEMIRTRECKMKNLFKYYTGITYIRFAALLAFLVGGSKPLKNKYRRKEVRDFSDEDGLLLTLCRLRHGFGLKDLSVRFGLTLQSTGSVFNMWLQHMYDKLGQLPIWSHRDSIIENMPSEFRNDFPTSLIIIDGTEVRTQTPSALALQSQLYSSYKSSTTLKGLIGCAPDGTVMFISELFTGSISDKCITERSGFYDTLKQMKTLGYFQDGDAIMVDKGFNIHREIEDLGLVLNIPPLARSGCQMAADDTSLTTKIAKHRVHIERLICKVKTFRLLSNRIPTSLFQKANQIWSVCCLLTLFQDTFVKDKPAK